jgi:hypothetical protein
MSLTPFTVSPPQGARPSVPHIFNPAPWVTAEGE